MATTTAIPIPSRKNKHPAASVDSAASTPPGSYGSATPSGSPSSENTQSKQRRRESLMSAAFSAQEHTVVNVGDAESPRLITCVKASQGFTWNQEIFLPSYADYAFDSDLERRQDPVQDIIVTEEEVRKMFPS